MNERELFMVIPIILKIMFIRPNSVDEGLSIKALMNNSAI